MTTTVYADLEQGCSVLGCDRPKRTRGWCGSHYNQWRDTGQEPTVPFTDEGRFFKHVKKSERGKCWEWQSTIKRNGYGQFWMDGRPRLAHRVSYELSNGRIPDGLLIRHTCDNKRCVNPAHLLTGDHKDNARDAVERGLHPRGEKQGRSKLTAPQVSEIRALRAAGETQKALARRFGVSTAAIQWILNGRTWAGIGEAS